MRLVIESFDEAIAALSLRLGFGEVVSVSILLDEAPADSADFRRACEIGSHGLIVGDELELAFDVSQLERLNRESDSAWLVSGLLGGLDQRDWLGFRVQPDEQAWLLYQRDANQTAWQFIKDYLDLRVAEPAAISQWEDLLDLNAVLFRHSSWTNRQTLEHLLQCLPGEYRAKWFGVCDDAPDFRIVDETTELTLDETWNLIGAETKWIERSSMNGVLPLTGAPPEFSRGVLGTHFNLEEGKAVPPVLQEVSKNGFQQNAQAAFGEFFGDRVEQFVVSPGYAKLRGVELQVMAVEYVWSIGNRTIDVYLCIEPRAVAPVEIPPQLELAAGVRGWSESDHLIELEYPTSAVGMRGRWRKLDSADPTRLAAQDDLLLAFVESSTATREDFQGMYVRHSQGDQRVLRVAMGQTPMVGGGWQRRNEVLESASITINEESVAISSSSSKTATEEANGLSVKSTAITIRAPDSVSVESKSAILNDNVEVTADSVAIKGDTQVDGKFNAGSMG